MRWDPKDGDLCLDRMKSGENRMEVRSCTDVQIVCLIWSIAAKDSSNHCVDTEGTVNY